MNVLSWFIVVFFLCSFTSSGCFFQKLSTVCLFLCNNGHWETSLWYLAWYQSVSWFYVRCPEVRNLRIRWPAEQILSSSAMHKVFRCLLRTPKRTPTKCEFEYSLNNIGNTNQLWMTHSFSITCLNICHGELKTVIVTFAQKVLQSMDGLDSLSRFVLGSDHLCLPYMNHHWPVTRLQAWMHHQGSPPETGSCVRFASSHCFQVQYDCYLG
jgi:hypothetical protein